MSVLKQKNITTIDLNNICLSISDDSLELDDACLVNGVDPIAFRKILRNPKKKDFVDNIKIAESRKIQNLIALVKTGRNNARQLLESIVPHYNRTFKLQLQYINKLLLSVIEKHVTPEQYLSIVKELAEKPEKELLAQIDNEIEK